jgi:hypothetical protein
VNMISVPRFVKTFLTMSEKISAICEINENIQKPG